MNIPKPARWLLVAVWMGVIFYMSSRQDSGDQSGALIRMIFDALGQHPAPDRMEFWHHLLRKAAHFTEYAVLGLLIAFARGRARLIPLEFLRNFCVTARESRGTLDLQTAEGVVVLAVRAATRFRGEPRRWQACRHVASRDAHTSDDASRSSHCSP